MKRIRIHIQIHIVFVSFHPSRIIQLRSTSDDDIWGKKRTSSYRHHFALKRIVGDIWLQPLHELKLHLSTHTETLFQNYYYEEEQLLLPEVYYPYYDSQADEHYIITKNITRKFVMYINTIFVVYIDINTHIIHIT